MKLTATRAREILFYDAETGILKWKQRRVRAGHEKYDRIWNSRWAGKIAGWNHKDHLAVGIDGGKYLAHRIAWLIHYGEMPIRDIDHINGSGKDNRIVNLRLATMSQNLANSKIRKDNKTGHKGVYQDKRDGRYYVKIKVEGKRIALGGYPTLKAAAAAYAAGSKRHHGEFGRLK